MALVGSLSNSFLNLGSVHAFAWILPQSALVKVATVVFLHEGWVGDLGLVGDTLRSPASYDQNFITSDKKTFPLQSARTTGQSARTTGLVILNYDLWLCQ